MPDTLVIEINRVSDRLNGFDWDLERERLSRRYDVQIRFRREGERHARSGTGGLGNTDLDSVLHLVRQAIREYLPAQE